jgi:hypothetical protein
VSDSMLDRKLANTEWNSLAQTSIPRLHQPHFPVRFVADPWIATATQG